MTVTLEIPDELSRELSAKFRNLGHVALEGLAAEAYAQDALSLEQIRQLLKLDSRWDAQEMLARHGLWPDQSAEEILADAQNSARFRTALVP